jgi:hypothetical protein
LKVRKKTPNGDILLSVIASPIAGKDLDENIYHAHAVVPESLDYYFAALHLRELFETGGSIEPIETAWQPQPGRLEWIGETLKRWLFWGRKR